MINTAKESQSAFKQFTFRCARSPCTWHRGRELLGPALLLICGINISLAERIFAIAGYYWRKTSRKIWKEGGFHKGRTFHLGISFNGRSVILNMIQALITCVTCGTESCKCDLTLALYQNVSWSF